MISNLAKSDLQRLRDNGYSPTDDDVIRLNDIAIRIERGKNTTVANMPRVANAGNVVLHEPTIGALEWWHNFGRDAAWTSRGKIDVYYWMLANATNPTAFYQLEKPSAIRRTVRKWKKGVFATDGELWRALIWVKSGENANDDSNARQPFQSTVDEDHEINQLYSALIAAAGALSMRPDDLKSVTADTLTALLVSANLHAKIPVKTSVAKDYIAYKLCIKEIESHGRRP